MSIYHIDRDMSMTLAQQKKILQKQYSNMHYLFSDDKQIHIIAD